MYEQIKRSISIATKIILGLFILTYFGASLVICDEDIPLCKESLKELKEDLKDWQKRCLDTTQEYSQDINTPCCNDEKRYIQSRRKMQRKLCFYKDLYPHPYLFIRSRSEIKAVDLLTHDASRVVNGLGDGDRLRGGLAIDINDKKLYFGDGSGSLWKANFDGSSRKTILKNAKVYKMAIDWIGRRIFWTKYPWEKRIFVVNVDGKHERTLTTTQDLTYGIAVDPLAGYLFWTEHEFSFYRMLARIQRMNLAKNDIVTLVSNQYGLAGILRALSLDYTNKRVYWVSDSGGILSRGYDGKTTTTVNSGSFNRLLLGIFEDSVYFQKSDVLYINEMNMTSRIISRSIKVNKTDYRDLVIVHSSLQPMAAEECSSTPCGRFAFCNISTGLCVCQVGFKKNASKCADIDECSSFPCGPNEKNSCTNFVGYYKCSCGDGFVIDTTERKCIAYSDLQIKLGKSNINKTGTIQIFHPSFGWGTICGWPRWTEPEGDVVCRQLGFTGVKVARKNAYYGWGNGPILLSNVRCSGNETFIWDCEHRGWKNDRDCHHGEDSGVDCY